MAILFLSGDVMTGRGIDQILRHPSDPVLYESYVRDARDYVALAEARSGPIPRGVDDRYLWGAALEELERAAPDARIVNLETAVTRSGEPWEGKGIHYRMHPGNVGCLAAARIDCCVLANNHVLDWGVAGLEETLSSLHAVGLKTAGAGADARTAAAPAIVDRGERGRVLVFAVGAVTSGIPIAWTARKGRAGVNVLREISAPAGRRLAEAIRPSRGPRDVVVVSVHWGDNWGYPIEGEHREFARALIESGVVDVVHGHSSHHAKGIELYRGRLILYGCGDFVTDYEGIGGHERYRADLALMYLPTLGPDGRLESLRMVPLVLRRFRLERAARTDAAWLKSMLERESLLDRTLEMGEDYALTLRP
jgi:poly-gamma-glutamate synthesis protein (capsule biosynthesis protein)